MGEKEIIALLLARDEKGVEELLTHFSPLMRYIIAPILPSEQDREECLFEAAMKVWEKIEQYSAERGTWKSWLTALTRNTALNYLRRSKSAADGGDISPATPSPEPTPEELLLRQERQAALNEALCHLSVNDRLIFYRKYYYRQSAAQIAAELGLTERAVEGRLYRMKKRLRDALGGENHE
ncbi:MAG: sigma-70 family RNA polymerase sigma factor [Oscillospiraceae bacterium]|nr:sigma-70 family RNA polymerase sigma factor [Oscillospiraceae bacterium]MCD8374482.1 sigma-70 family RNA polymerase sigma factor [Oscillospiraceae bacterium]